MPIKGTATAIRVNAPGGSGGEGPWYYSDGCGYIDVTGLAAGDTVVCWGGELGDTGGITTSGSAGFSAIAEAPLIAIFTITSPGDLGLTLSCGGSILAHVVRFGTGFTVTVCG
jgi:hypothetical protein